MPDTNTRDGRTEQNDIQLRNRALRSLMRRRSKQLREPLDHRIERARKGGLGIDLTRAEWVSLHRQEMASIRVQLADLELEQGYARKQLAALKKVLARAKRLRRAQHASSRVHNEKRVRA